MRRIDIVVAYSEDVQNELNVTERLIRLIAAELDVSVRASYPNHVRRLGQADETTAPPANASREGISLFPHFWEYQDESEEGYPERIHNIAGSNLVVWILWSRLAGKLIPAQVTPDSQRPGQAIDSKLAWLLDRSKRNHGFPGLHVYRNRATPAIPLEPKEKRETLCRQWDEVQEFFARWEQSDASQFRDCVHDFQNLEEFENLFRKHFSEFLAEQLDLPNTEERAPHKKGYWKSNPFRGLNFFDFEHSAIYHGRTKAIGEVLTALKSQAAAKKPFLLVLGPTGSGKSSLVRAGVLPFLTQVGGLMVNGLWRRAVTRPSGGGASGDPFDALAAALITKSALPELRDATKTNGRRSLAAQLKEDPNAAALRIMEVLDRLTPQELDQGEGEELPATSSEGAKVITQASPGWVKPRTQLALIVDQLEELFTAGFSPELQRTYTALLGCLAKCEHVFTIATLRNDFYSDYQQFPELVQLAALGGKYELQPPTHCVIGDMIRLPAAAAGLRFERDPQTGRNLDDALLEAATAKQEPLSVLEHLLSQLYLRQFDRKDGLLRWSDYRACGELQGALANQLETVFSTLKRDEKRALKFVIRHLVTLARGEGRVLNLRTIPYRDLVQPAELDQQQRTAVKGLVDRLIKEGLLITDADPKRELLIRVSQEALLLRWPGIWQWLLEDQNFCRMRDRLDASLALWMSRGCRSDDLLERGIELAEAEALLNDFESSLSETHVDYIQQSLARHKRWRIRDMIGLAVIGGVIGGVAAFGAVGLETSNTDSRQKGAEQDPPEARRHADFVTNLKTAVETQLKKAEEKALPVQQTINLAVTQGSPLDPQLDKTQEDTRQARKRAGLAVDQSSSGQTQPLNPAENSESLTSPNQ
jgi:AAA ATPase domain